MKIDEKLLGELTWTDVDGWTTVQAERITDQGRWSTYHTMVVKHEETDKFYRIDWATGSTESQEVDADITYHEVTPVAQMITVYENA